MKVDIESVGVEPDGQSELVDHTVEVGERRADVCIAVQDLAEVQQEGHVLVLPILRQEVFHCK